MDGYRVLIMPLNKRRKDEEFEISQVIISHSPLSRFPYVKIGSQDTENTITIKVEKTT